MNQPALVVTNASDRLVAMVALRSLDRLIASYLGGDKNAFDDRFRESKALVLSDRAKELLEAFKELEVQR